MCVVSQCFVVNHGDDDGSGRIAISSRVVALLVMMMMIVMMMMVIMKMMMTDMCVCIAISCMVAL